MKKGSTVILLEKEDWSKLMNSKPPLDDSTEGHWYDRVITRSRFFRKLTQGSLSGNLCGLFNDKNHRKTMREKERGKETGK